MDRGLTKANFVIILIAVTLISIGLTTIILTRPITLPVSGSLISSGTANVTINQTVSIALNVSDVDFGALAPSSIDNTTDDAVSPFVVENSGNINVDVDVRINSSLFSGTGAGNNTNTFRYRTGNCSATICGLQENNTFDWVNSTTTWTNFTDLDVEAINSLKYNNSEDEVELEIYISVPADEPEGNKTSLITFTGSQEA